MTNSYKIPDNILERSTAKNNTENVLNHRVDEENVNVAANNVDDNENVKKEIDFDDILSLAGEFGIYQVYLFVQTFPFYTYGALVYFVQLFMTEVPGEHWCWIPELANLTAVERRSLAIPLDENGRYGYSQCSMYVADWSEVLNTGIKPDAGWKITSCKNGWEFNRTEIPYPTVGTDFEWVCEKDSYQATAQSVFFVGSVLGGFLIGWIADRFGRLPAAVISCLIGSVGGIASIFTKNLTEFALTRFIMGISYDNCMMMTYIILIEYIAPKYRTVIANLSYAIFFALGVCVLPWIALACGHWKTLSLVVSVYLALAIFAPLLVPESPKWLLSKGRVQEAVNKLVYIGKINRKKIPPKIIDNFILSASSTNGNREYVSGFELIKRPSIRTVFLLVCLQYLCFSSAFDVISRSVGQFGLNIFVSFTAISFTELPSLVIVAFAMDWMGRRWMGSMFAILCFLFSILTAFVPAGLPSVLCAVVARFAINISCNVTIQWAAELFPTGVRASATSVVHICGYVGTIISPYIVYLETVVPWLPLVICGLLVLTGAMTALVLTETAGKNLPQTFEEAEELIRNKRFWEAPFIKTKKSEEVNGCKNASFEM